MSMGIATSSSAPCAFTSMVLPRVKTGSGSSSSSEQAQTSTSILTRTRSLRLQSRERLLPLALLGSEGLELISLADGPSSSAMAHDMSCQSFKGNLASFGGLASEKRIIDGSYNRHNGTCAVRITGTG